MYDIEQLYAAEWAAAEYRVYCSDVESEHCVALAGASSVSNIDGFDESSESYIYIAVVQGILVERLTGTLWPDYLDNKTVVLGLLERLGVIVKQSARLSCSVSVSYSFISPMKTFRFYHTIHRLGDSWEVEWT